MYREKKYLVKEYIEKNRSESDIAKEWGIDHKNHRVSLRVKNKGSKEVLQALADYFSFTGSVKMYKGCYDLTITSDVLISKLGL